CLARSPAARAAPPASGAVARRRALLTTDRRTYLGRIARALDYIAAGDVYQVNLSHRIECAFEGDPLSLFLDLAARNPAPFAAYIDAGDFQVVSASPERLVSVVGDRARSSPIKGTRPRGDNAGGIGYLSLDGGMDFNIVIRTLVCAKGIAHLRVGGGIVADSDPEREHGETLDKARALLDVLNADLANL